MGPIWGIDLGGTKIEAVVLENKKSSNIISRMRIPTEAHKGRIHIMKQIHRLIEVVSTEISVKPTSIGIGTPGCIDPYSGKIKNSNASCLNGSYLKQDLEKILGIPIKMANDANCFALAETKFGVVKEHLPEASVIFGIIMGTGVGGGLVVHGHIVEGLHGLGGEWGHNFLDDSGGPCYCGQNGCVETIISGPAIENYYEDITGISRSMKEIVQLSNENDSAAKRCMLRLTNFFGKAIAVVINIIDPDAIIIGGGLGNISSLYTDGKKETEKYIFNHRMDTKFLKPQLGDSAGVFGAALLND